MNILERIFCAAWWLVRMHPGSHIPLAASRESYLASGGSKRTSRMPSPRTARMVSSGSFEFRDQHLIAVQPLPFTPHTHPPPPPLVEAVVARSRRREGSHLNL